MLFDCIISQLIVKGLSKTHQDFISINEFFSKITPSLFTIKEAFFRKPTSPPLPLREGPPLISVFSPQGRRGNRPTRCSNRFAIRLADHQRSRQQRSCGLRYATAWTKIAYGLLGACSKLFRKPTWISLALMRDFSKTHQSSLTLKGGSTSHLGLLPSGKKRKPPYSVLKPLRYKVGGPSEVFASSGASVFCAGINPLSLKDLLRGCLVDA